MQSAIADIETLIYYAKKFQRLRVDRAHGVAPHKPILLLSVIESFAKGRITENRIELSELLNQTFLKNWSYLGSPCHHPDIARPFFHMKSGKFWHLYANPGFEKVLAAKIKLKTLAEVKQAISHAYLDEDLFDFLLDASIRKSLLAVLVGRWFPGRLAEVKKILQTDEFQEPPEYFLEAYAMHMERLKEA
jgi:putative restriction endonuclease